MSMAEGTMPWQVEGKGKSASEHFKYQYHPGGDPNAAPKNAPSALHSVIVPNVNLPKVSVLLIACRTRAVGRPNCGIYMLIMVNRNCMRSTTSGERMITSYQKNKSVLTSGGEAL